MEETIYCNGIDARIKISEAQRVGTRYVYGGVYCDTGEPVRPDHVEGLLRVHTQLDRLDSNQIVEVEKFINELIN